MVNISDKEKCCGCSACRNVCPLQCIDMTADNEGFLYPVVNQSICVDCHLCEKVCPINNKKEKQQQYEKSCYAAISRDEKLRSSSSSGGIFSELATEILHVGGVVYGAAMDETCKNVVHTEVKDVKNLPSLQGSKYVQSDMNEIYLKVQDSLEHGKTVLFSGVSCQINALKSYLGKNYTNLICVDVICHGVPSPRLWKKYTDYLEEKYRAAISNVQFRYKKYVWQSFGMYYENDNSNSYYCSKEFDPFLRMFLNDYCLRPSCYMCQFKGFDREADITIGDFWGVDEYTPGLNDGKGTSIVLIHSLVGQRLFEKIMNKLQCERIEYKDVFEKHNDAMLQSVKKPKERKDFFEKMNSVSFEELAKIFVPLSMKQKIRFFLKNSCLYEIVQKWRNGEMKGGTPSNSEYGLLVRFEKRGEL